MPKPAILVVSSHVVRGSVGGRAAVFALQRLGFPVWSLPTVILPWHPGQGASTRVPFDRAAFAGAVADLAGWPALAEVGAVLTGYFGDASQIEPVAELVALVKARNPEALYLCDPVVGDADGLFRPPAVVEGIRDRLLPLADIATPNRHELIALTGGTASDNDDLAAMAAALGPQEVAVTSAFAPQGQTALLLHEPRGLHLAVHAALDTAPRGTGDLFAALYLAHSLDGAAPPVALERAASATLAAIRQARAQGVDELPLAEVQDAFAAAPVGVTVSRVGRA